MIGRLHLKVLLVVGGVVGLCMIALVAASSALQRRSLIEQSVEAAIHVLDSTYAGLAQPMESGHGEAMAQHLATVAHTMPGMEIFLLDTGATVVFSSVPESVDTPVGPRLPGPGLAAAVGASMGPDAGEKPLRLSESPPVVLRPIRNAPSCHHCHGQSRQVLGGLMVHQTRDGVAAKLGSAIWQTLAVGSAMAIVVIGLVFLLLGSLVLRPLTDIGRTAAAIAAGDLTPQARSESTRLARQLDHLIGQDEIGGLGKIFETMTRSLREILQDLQRSTSVLDREAVSAQAAAAQQSSLATEQSAAIAETSAVVAQIAQTSKLSTDHADSVAGVCDRSDSTASAGQQAVSDALSGLGKLSSQVGSIARSITELSELTRRISEIVASVEDLSEQSNLLALNAAIEASRAGASGVGFAVVASEMRRLARQSKDAAGQARALLSQVVAGTRSAVVETEEGSRRAEEAAELAKSAGESIAGMAGAIRESAEAARQIANQARQQTTGVEQIVAAVGQLSTAASDTVDSARRLQSVAEGLAAVSGTLTALAGRFKA